MNLKTVSGYIVTTVLSIILPSIFLKNTINKINNYLALNMKITDIIFLFLWIIIMTLITIIKKKLVSFREQKKETIKNKEDSDSTKNKTQKLVNNYIYEFCIFWSPDATPHCCTCEKIVITKTIQEPGLFLDSPIYDFYCLSCKELIPVFDGANRIDARDAIKIMKEKIGIRSPAKT